MLIYRDVPSYAGGGEHRHHNRNRTSSCGSCLAAPMISPTCATCGSPLTLEQFAYPGGVRVQFGRCRPCDGGLVQFAAHIASSTPRPPRGQPGAGSRPRSLSFMRKHADFWLAQMLSIRARRASPTKVAATVPSSSHDPMPFVASSMPHKSTGRFAHAENALSETFSGATAHE